ncbi:MAG: hypothetical protein AAF329_24015 [Cyanobacteria bacterium P01_A01_bin.17]
MLLRNQDLHREILQIGVVRNSRERFRGLDNEDNSCDGFFFGHDGRLFGLGAESGAIFIILNGQLVKYDATLETQLAERPHHNISTVYQSARRLCVVTYKPVKASGWIPNEDDECLDGFLWMHNILRSAARRIVIVSNQSND